MPILEQRLCYLCGLLGMTARDGNLNQQNLHRTENITSWETNISFSLSALLVDDVPNFPFGGICFLVPWRGRHCEKFWHDYTPEI